MLKKIMRREFRATLNFRKVKVALNSLRIIFWGVLWRPLCYHRRGLFVCVSGIARSSGRNSVLTWRELSIQRPFLFWVYVMFLLSLPSRVGCSFQGLLFSIFKLLCIVPCILCYLHLDPRRYIPPKQAIYFSRKPLTYPGLGSASVQYGLNRRTEYLLSQALTF